MAITPPASGTREVTLDELNEHVDERIEKRFTDLSRQLAEGNKLHWTSGSDGDTEPDVQRRCDLVKMDCLSRGYDDPYKSQLAQDPAFKKALDTATGSSGAEWVMAQTSTMFWADTTYRSKLYPLIQHTAMETKALSLPTAEGTVTAYLAPENTTPTSHTPAEASPATANASFSAERIAIRTVESAEMFSDSGPAALDIVRAKLQESMGYWLDRVILDGDTAGTHMDSAAVGATDPRKAWDGWRDRALTDGATVDISTCTADNLVKLPALLADNEDPDEMLWVMNGVAFWKNIPTLKDASGNALFLPATVIGATTPAATGKLGRLLGIPVVLTKAVRADLSQYGYYSVAGGYTQVDTVVHCVHLPSWRIGERQSIQLEVERSVAANTLTFVASFRGDMQPQSSTRMISALGINLAA